MLERGALSDAKVVELSARFICVKVNPKDQGDLARMMGVSRLPDVRIVSPQGHEERSWQGGVSAEALAKGMAEVLASK